MKEIIQEVLQDLRINFEKYSLVNNYGMTFEYNGNKFDIRHNLNCYGVAVNYWDITKKNKNGSYESHNISGLSKEVIKNFITS